MRRDGCVAAARRARLHAPQHALDAREQFARVEGLRDVVVGADLEPDDAVDDAAGAGHHDDADVVALAQEAREAQPVLARQLQVEQHDVGRGALDLARASRRRPRPAPTRYPSDERYSDSISRIDASSSTTSTQPAFAIAQPPPVLRRAKYSRRTHANRYKRATRPDIGRYGRRPACAANAGESCPPRVDNPATRSTTMQAPLMNLEFSETPTGRPDRALRALRSRPRSACAGTSTPT